MLLSILQAMLLLFLAAGAVCVVATRDPLRQTVAISLYGLLLALLFFTFQAPDVALSALVVGSVALPMLILLALAKVGAQSEARARQERKAP